LGHRLVALQAVLITNWESEDSGLDCHARIPKKCVSSAHQLSLHPLRNPLPGVTIDAPGLLGGVECSQIDRLGIHRSLVES
jgi:hypothetical protein